MPWVTFAADYDFSPDKRGGRVTLAYKAGTRANVTRECARKAEAAGRLVKEEHVDGSTDRRG